MSTDVLRRALLVTLVLLVSIVAFAQEATFSGTIVDSTGAVLPGATVTAIHEASGNLFTAVTDERGEFRLPVRVGGYSITTELSGFTAVTRSLQILVGQIAVVNVQMSPSAVQETVTVTGEAPLVDLRDEGGTRSGEFRLRADGSIVPRNGLVGEPIHKVDLRIQKRLPLVGRVAVDGIFEVFNLFNHANYGAYVRNESNANFGQPAFNANVQYFPRMLQLGFRATF